MQTLSDIPPYTKAASSRRGGAPKTRSEGDVQTGGKLHGRVSEVTILGRTLAILAPIASVIGVGCGLPTIVGAVGLFASLFGVAICVAERRAVTKY